MINFCSLCNRPQECKQGQLWFDGSHWKICTLDLVFMRHRTRGSWMDQSWWLRPEFLPGILISFLPDMMMTQQTKGLQELWISGLSDPVEMRYDMHIHGKVSFHYSLIHESTIALQCLIVMSVIVFKQKGKRLCYIVNIFRLPEGFYQLHSKKKSHRFALKEHIYNTIEMRTSVLLNSL